MGRRAKVIRFPGLLAGAKQNRAGAPARRGTDDQSFVEVHRCRDQSEALVLEGLLESDGIRCVLRTRLAHSVHPFTVGDQGEVTVLVPEPDVPRARLLIARISSGPSIP